MRAVDRVIGGMAPLDRADVDTDQIMPKQYLKRVQRTGFGEFVFHDWREDPDFAVTSDLYAGAAVLVTGPNFGAGSSREHAAWGLQEFGFDAIVAPSFADIFRSNCTKIGLLTAQVTPKVAARLIALAASQPGAEVALDLVECSIRAEGVHASFDIPATAREALLSGEDEIASALRLEPQIDAYEKARPDWLPAATGTMS
jgi:3-isopropylmalate/(R)-2-methylmalate dehydratase small subunit